MSDWISVKDQLPDCDAPILYVVKDRGSDSYVKAGIRADDGSEWWWCDLDGDYDETGNDPGFSTVTHWMPLPEPPKGMA